MDYFEVRSLIEAILNKMKLHKQITHSCSISGAQLSSQYGTVCVILQLLKHKYQISLLHYTHKLHNTVHSAQPTLTIKCE